MSTFDGNEEKIFQTRGVEKPSPLFPHFYGLFKMVLSKFQFMVRYSKLSTISGKMNKCEGQAKSLQIEGT